MPGRMNPEPGTIKDAGDKGGRDDPYKWAGKVGIDSGPVPISRWRGNVLNVEVGGPTQARTSGDRIADQQLRPEIKPNKKKGDKRLEGG